MKFPIKCKIFWLNYSWIHVLKDWNAQGKLLLRITGAAVKLNLLVVTVNRISSYEIQVPRIDEPPMELYTKDEAEQWL